MSPKIQESVKADCGLYLETDKFDVFQRNIDIICNAKGYPIEKVNICPCKSNLF